MAQGYRPNIVTGNPIHPHEARKIQDGDILYGKDGRTLIYRDPLIFSDDFPGEIIRYRYVGHTHGQRTFRLPDDVKEMISMEINGIDSDDWTYNDAMYQVAYAASDYEIDPDDDLFFIYKQKNLNKPKF